MGHLIIKKVLYSGDNYFYESPELKSGLNIIEGPNGTGKSTFMDLIYYGFGGKVNQFQTSNRHTTGQHSEITNDTNNYIELQVEINSDPYLLKRFISQNDIYVKAPDKELERLGILRNKNQKYIFSDWLLEKLKIDVVELYQAGDTNYKLNITDLFRLIYHNQELNPSKIYKSPDAENYITDSEEIRKTIFQILIGQTFTEYYKALATQKRLEKEKSVAKSVLNEYNIIASRLQHFNDNLNLVFLQDKKTELEQQLSKLYSARNALKENRPPSQDSVIAKVEELKSFLIGGELKYNQIQESRVAIVEEQVKLNRLKEDVILDVTHIKKIIHTHDSLALFSLDTCPYCLRDVKRDKGKCVCGNAIEEKEYEKFFYNTNEYTDILKSKQKTVETINIAIASVQEEYDEIMRKSEQQVKENLTRKHTIQDLLKSIDNNVDINQLNQIDDKILDVRNSIQLLNQQIEIEHSRVKHQEKFDSISVKHEKQKNITDGLRASASNDILEKVRQFNEIYNDLMINTLQDCHSAKISFDNYMPIINNGEYREASSGVTIRLNYFFTLLALSLNHRDVHYPRFLVIDTPRTAGIDETNLIKAISQIGKLHSKDNDKLFQIILSTGLGTYPDKYENNIFQSLDEDNKLLKTISN